MDNGTSIIIHTPKIVQSERSICRTCARVCGSGFGLFVIINIIICPAHIQEEEIKTSTGEKRQKKTYAANWHKNGCAVYAVRCVMCMSIRTTTKYKKTRQRMCDVCRETHLRWQSQRNSKAKRKAIRSTVDTNSKDSTR